MRLGMMSDIHGNLTALEAALADADADIVGAGHTHQATDRAIDGMRAINLGSVSNPVTDDLRASYVIIDVGDDDHRVEHRWFAYDRDAFLARLECSGHPEVDHIASFQRGEQVRHHVVRPIAPLDGA